MACSTTTRAHAVLAPPYTRQADCHHRPAAGRWRCGAGCWHIGMKSMLRRTASGDASEAAGARARAAATVQVFGTSLCIGSKRSKAIRLGWPRVAARLRPNGVEAKLSSFEASFYSPRAFDWCVNRLLTPTGRQYVTSRLPPIRHRPWGQPRKARDSN